ncbi:MBL fold metallo-hydrolase [Sphingomicrobium clamense]|uniref:beta-lactamase n=1 Tax=Sphingomicrobium clamense TaxID=2851013 RepID=A0ABS6V563_9SPHN|nr:MBL fold metallo-hydrolase [Sphingomicrobium sp. B8]MBW0144696.1 MBL fold metallo-hydrolase [Sphingomicrobium sp. B8]
MRFALLASAFLFASPALAQDDRFANVEIEVVEVAPNVAVLFGQGGNIALSHGDDGNVLIDDQFAPLVPKIVAAVEGISDGPVRFVINTHHHGDHTGGNEAMAEAGALVMAHDNVRKNILARLAENGDTSGTHGSLPVITFDSSVDLHWNGETIDIVHVHHAHTDGDALVFFTGSKVLHMGDTYFNGVTWPYIDTGNGGSIDGLVKAIASALARIDDSWTVIPGHGPVATHDDLHAYHDMLKTLRDGVAAAIAAGETLEQVQARDLTAGYDVEDGFISGDKFIEVLYNQLSD